MNEKKTERSSLEFYLKQKYPITLYPDPDEGYVAEIKDLPGCITQGETAEEALAELEDARILWIKTAYEHGDAISLPSTETKYSGKTLLRMARSLHQKLAEGAEREGVSLNQYIVSLLSEASAVKAIPLKQITKIQELQIKQIRELTAVKNNIMELLTKTQLDEAKK
jgi:predicted RNase H-like HicB family nuclease